MTILGKRLDPDVDYKVSFENNDHPGMASVSIEGIGNYLGSASADFRIIPTAPSDLEAVPASATTVDISWSAPAGAQYVEVWRSTDPSCAYGLSSTVCIGIYNASDGKSTSKLLTSGRTYYYKTRAYAKDANGVRYYSAYSQVVEATVPVLAAPSNVIITPLSATKMEVTWSAPADAQFVEVWRSSDPSCAYGLSSTVCIGIYNASDGRAVSKLLTPNTAYYYKTRAYIKNGSSRHYSGYSEVVGTWTTEPTWSKDISATATSRTTVRITWEKPEGATFVEVWRSTDPSCAYGLKSTVCIGIYNASDQQAISKLLTPGTTYYYKCRAYHRTSTGRRIYSPYSEVVSATPR